MRCQMAACVVHGGANQVFDIFSFGYHSSTIPANVLSSESPRIDQSLVAC